MGVTTTTNNTFPQPFPDTLTNYTVVAFESDLPAAVGGEHVLVTGTYEFVDDPVTASSQIITMPIVTGEGQLIIVRGDKLANPLVYTGGGAFERATLDKPPLSYIQLNFLLVSVGGTGYNHIGGDGFFIDNFAFIGGKGIGLVSNTDAFIQFNNAGISFETTYDTPLTISNTTNFVYRNGNYPNSTVLTGPMIEVSNISSAITISSIFFQTSSGQSLLNISPINPDDVRVNILDNNFNASFGGDFFEPGTQGAITAYADNSSTDSITAFADNGSGGTTVTSMSAHGLSDGRTVIISATTSYNGTFEISAASGSIYDIPVAFVADDATGTWNFNSVTITSAAHGLSNGSDVQIEKSTNYNVGREIFGVLTNTYDIDNIAFNGDDGTGQWDSGSLKQDDSRMTVSANGDQSDTAQLSNSTISITEVITITMAGQFEPITTWANTIDRQFTANAPGESTGSLRYDGNAITARADFTVTGVMASGGAKSISVAIFKKPDGGAFSQIGQAVSVEFGNKDVSLTGFITGIELSALDVIELRVANEDDTVNINIDLASCSISAQAQGF